MNIIEKMFGTHSQRELKRIMPIVDKIDSLRPSMQALSDEELRGKEQGSIKNVWKKGETLDATSLPQASLQPYVRQQREYWVIWSTTVFS